MSFKGHDFVSGSLLRDIPPPSAPLLVWEVTIRLNALAEQQPHRSTEYDKPALHTA